MVRLKVPTLFDDSRPIKRCFNSTMVRLKVYLDHKRIGGIEEFQFHNGSIKRSAQVGAGAAPFFSFNSTMVRLKDLLRCNHQRQIFCFNSTMVRLKEATRDEKNAMRHGFNSTMVRLKESHTKGHNHYDKVSIPQWFD